ncbi:Hypothetical predicted protein [Cloeon dipterum]|uniref:MHD domain-containing protein n=1 Tax=Cloeon dipterum TaxID=197152 RepID=A0A8S1CXP4_9INSE|nr:Hypothetical predicted protein [Cloeon dipterum]
MPFALRAFWVISPNEGAPVFQRLFPTVELRAQKTNNYQKLFEPNKFVEAVLVETGIKNSESFVFSRDRCDKMCMAPAFQVSTGDENLEPVVILQHRGLLLCALPLIEDPQSSVLEVAQTLDCLNAIAERLGGDLSQRTDLKMQLAKLMAINFPFGRPQTESIALSEQVIQAALQEKRQDKTKVAIWNPNPQIKNKSHFVFHISEQIHLVQNQTFATGVISVMTNEISSHRPEVLVTMTHSSPMKFMALAPRAKIEMASDASTTLKFNPSSVKSELLHYSTSCLAPIDFKFTENAISKKLTLAPIKTPFQRLEFKFYSAGKISKFNMSVGTAYEDENGIKWDVPVSKLKCKSAEFEVLNNADVKSSKDKFSAEAVFSMSSDCCWSGVKIDQNGVSVNGSTSKIKITTSSETLSGSYQVVLG